MSELTESEFNNKLEIERLFATQACLESKRALVGILENRNLFGADAVEFIFKMAYVAGYAQGRVNAGELALETVRKHYGA